MRSARLLAAVALVLPALAPKAASAQEFQVNTYTTDSQALPDVGADEAGNFVVVWQSFGSPPSPTTSTIRGRRFDAEGTPLGADFQISTATGFKSSPRVGVAPGGEFVVVWSTYETFLDPDGFDLRGRRFSAAGSPLGSDFQINSFTPGRQTAPDVAASNGGAFVVLWESELSPGIDQSAGSILGRRFSASGTPQGSDFQVNSYTTSVQRRPRVVADADGRFFTVWQSLGSPGNDAADFAIVGRRFDAGGNPFASDFQVNSYTTGYQGRPSVAVNSTDEFIVAWQSFGSPGTDASNQAILARRFNPAGAAEGFDFQANVYTTGSQNAPSVALSPGGEFLVSWNQSSATPNPDRSDVWGRLFNADGSPQGGDFRLNTFADDVQGDVGAAALLDGDFLAAWTSQGSPDSDTSERSVRATRVGGECTPSATRLCLNGGRFAVDVAWRTPQGQQGTGQAVPLTADSGYFWFFNADNVELILKVLNACTFNGYYWTFSAGLTNVEVDISVTDSLTGIQATYHNPINNPFQPILDTESLPSCGTTGPAALPGEAASLAPEAAGERLAGERASTDLDVGGPEAVEPAGAATAGPAGLAPRGGAPDLHLLGGRFQVEVSWRTPQGQTGFGQPVQLTDRAAFFTFFNPNNVELILKMQDACSFNERFWVFSAGLTNVEVSIEVTDTANGTVKTYFNPLNQPFPAILDTGAFATCP